MAKKITTTKDTETTNAVATVAPGTAAAAVAGAAVILIAPRITEKAARASERGAYVFDVAPGTTKSEIAKAFFKKYNKKPVKVTTVTARKRYDFVRGKLRPVRETKKATVFLKKGETITL